jgi:phosphatidylglycerol:prolipoprotein diacylglycerol transferase
MFDPVAFTLFEHPFRWYGILVALGFLFACVNWNMLDRRAGFPSGFGSEFGFVVMSTGLIGSRLGHVIGEWRHYLAHPMEIFHVQSGGMVFYGGFLLAVAAVWVLGRIRKIALIDLVDYGVAGLALGHGVGRIGCFLNGCCYGRETSSFIGCFNHGAVRLPTQLFEFFYLMALCAFLNWFYLKRKKFRGQVTALYLALYGGWRFTIEFFRADNRNHFASLSSGQWVSIGLITVAALIWLKRAKAQEVAT